jgi:hypothetical protein
MLTSGYRDSLAFEDCRPKDEISLKAVHAKYVASGRESLKLCCSVRSTQMIKAPPTSENKLE